MALVTVLASPLNGEQKQRIGQRVLDALFEEGIPVASIMIRFEAEAADISVEGAFFPAAQASAAVASAPVVAAAPAALPEVSAARPPRSKAEREVFKARLVAALQMAGSLSSFEAQKALDLSDCDWAPGTLRGFFNDLQEEKQITKFGQKRGTRYQWEGLLRAQETPEVKIVKAGEEE